MARHRQAIGGRRAVHGWPGSTVDPEQCARANTEGWGRTGGKVNARAGARRREIAGVSVWRRARGGRMGRQRRRREGGHEWVGDR